MTIWVCGKHEVEAFAWRYRPSYLLTILDVGDELETPFGILPTNHKRLFFWDTEHKDRMGSPTIENCQDILNWASEIPDNKVVLIHCYAGMSRSTSTAMAIHVLKNGLESIDTVSDWIVKIRPIAMPNMLMANHYDTLLSADGKFVAACQKVNNRANGYLLRQLVEED